MYINTVKSKNAVSYYLCEAYRNAQGKTKTRVVESLGNAEHIRATYQVDDVAAWCKEYARRKTDEAKLLAQKNNRTVTVEFTENKSKSEDSVIFNAGYCLPPVRRAPINKTRAGTKTTPQADFFRI